MVFMFLEFAQMANSCFLRFSYGPCRLEDAFKSIAAIAEQGQSTPGMVKPIELRRLLKHAAENNYELRAYDGFEPSGGF